MYTVSPHSVVPDKFIFLFSVNFSCSQPTKVPACQHLKNEVLNCYKQNPTQSLKCSQQVRAFINCVEQSQMVRGAHSILYRNSWSLTAKELILERMMWQPSNYFFFFISFLGSSLLKASVVECQSVASIDPLTDTWPASWLTLDWHLNDTQLTSRSRLGTLDGHSVNSHLIVTWNWQSVNWLIYQLTHDSVSAKISQLSTYWQLRWRSSVDWVSIKMFIACQSRCQWCYIEGWYWSTLNHRCL